LSLRNTLSVAMAVLAALALSAAVSLVVVAAYFHRAAGELAAAVESVRLAEAVQVDLLSHSHLRSPGLPPGDPAQRRLEADLRRRMSEMHAFAASPAEGQLVRTMQERVEAYLAASRASVDQQMAKPDFEPFRRGSRHDGIPGMGLGLSVARRIVEAHGGVLTAPGAGAAFHVRLPSA
jgi:hypothetical protein